MSNLSNAQDSSKIGYMKKYAFDYCLYINYNKVDSTFLYKYKIKDKSSTEFSSLGKITEKEQKAIRDFTKKETEKFYSMGHPYYSEEENSNIIVARCFYFYESKELDKFIRKLLKK
jgi:hypothetical protein